MNQSKLIAIVLLVAGAFALAYGSFTYTRETKKADIGPVELTVKDKETVNIPVWVGVAALAAGGILLVAPRKG